MMCFCVKICVCGGVGAWGCVFVPQGHTGKIKTG